MNILEHDVNEKERAERWRRGENSSARGESVPKDYTISNKCRFREIKDGHKKPHIKEETKLL